MEPATTFYSGILLLGAAQGLFLALALVNIKGGNALAHRLLALLTLTFAVDLGLDFLKETRYLAQVPKLYFFEAVTNFLYGPLTYLYVRALTSRDGFRFSNRTWCHFLPFVISIMLLVPFFNLSNDHILDLIYAGADIDDSIGLWIIGGLVVEFIPIPLTGIYLALGFRRLIHHSRVIRDEFSSIERISLIWLRNLLLALGMLFLIYLFAVVFSGALGIDEDKAENSLNLAIVVVIYTIGYLGIRQPDIFSPRKIDCVPPVDPTEIISENSAATKEKKYRKSALDAETSSALLQELELYMASKSPHLDSSLTLTQLADQLRISSNYLSQVINEQTGNNFFDFINRHRVEEAKRLLANPNQVQANILTIAMDAGFNSKSAFYTAFRRHAGGTPSQYRKSVAPH